MPSVNFARSTNTLSELIHGESPEHCGSSNVTIKEFSLAKIERPNDERSVSVLTRLLSFVGSENDARRLAQQLLSEFETLGALLATTPRRLQRNVPDCFHLLGYLSSLRELLSATLAESIGNRPLIKDLADLNHYLQINLGHDQNESVRILYLDSSNRLIKDEIVATGNTTSVVLQPRIVVERVLEIGASGVIIAHNHPSGDPTPSREDIFETQKLEVMFSKLSIRLADHVIVGRDRCFSMRRLKHIGRASL